MILTVTSSYDVLTMLGFLLMGIGASNIVPVIFGSAGKADPGSPELALAAVTTLGYAGQLAGPALIGFAADSFFFACSSWHLVHSHGFYRGRIC